MINILFILGLIACGIYGNFASPPPGRMSIVCSIYLLILAVAYLQGWIVLK